MAGGFTERVLDELNARRTERQALVAARERQMRGQCPEIRELEAKIARASLSEREALPALMRARENAVGEWMRSAGLPEDWLSPPTGCPVCQDTGFAAGKLCACVRNEAARRMFSEAGLTANSPSFEKFSLELFSEGDKLRNGRTVRATMEALRGYCLSYADGFPENKMPNLLFTGKPGLGKSYLMDCVASRVISRGFWVVRATAFSVNDVMAKALFDRADPDSLFDCDLLALDDLGTEPILNKVTISSFFNLLNERVTQGKPFIVSTNLTPEEILQRYGDRVFSRITDARATGILKFEGTDLRRGL